MLRPEVEAQYDIPAGVVAEFVSSEFGHVDLTKIGLEFAERLAEKGYLIKKPD